jgi:3'-phosphoadenosine 5'-phosphosulfate sulfotransferase (PAPS reductase)/FAD synthetase
MKRDAFMLPEGNVQIAFSGGRTSAYMLHRILEANGSLPERVVVAFCNTGREMPETLDFVQEVGSRWGAPIVWLEYRPEAPLFEVVSHNSASRNGEPFEALIRKKKGLPYKFARFCTSEMKVHCSTRYLRSVGWDRWHSAIGIRADEAHRLPKKELKERWQPWHPLAAAGVSKRDVAAFWARQSFDLGLPTVNGKTTLGNCDGCFLKSEASRAMLARDYPERFAWWERMEATCSANGWTGRNQTFLDGQIYAGLREFVERQSDWIFDNEDFFCQADDGECVA